MSSLALIGFGLDWSSNLVGGAVAWSPLRRIPRPEGLRFIAFSFFALAAYVTSTQCVR